MYNFYETHTELSLEVIKEKLLPPNDVWLTAAEAYSYGLCDRIANLSEVNN
jgi:ATP-dependent protease ClpP protease subunit